jgi:hypothetical protein
LAIGAIGLLLYLKLAGAFNDIVAGALDVDSRVVRRRVLLNGVSALRFDSDFTLLLDLGNLAARLTTAPAP